MEKARCRALTHQQNQQFVHRPLLVEMKEARCRALTHSTCISEIIAKFSVEMEEARCRALIQYKMCVFFSY